MSFARVKVDATAIDATLLTDVQALFAGLEGTWYVTYGWRSRAEQATLRAKFEAGGPRAAAPENSAHVGENFPDGKARAIDCTLVVDGADVWDYTHPCWRALVEAVKAHPRLHSLDDIGDTDHIETVSWHRERTVAA